MSYDRGKHLVMHVDSNIVPERPFLQGLPLPASTDTFTPVAHEDFDNLVQEAIRDAGITIKSSEYGLSNPEKDPSNIGVRYRHKFFVAHDTVDNVTDGVGMVIGARSSTDKSFAAGLVFGQRVFICDNTAFSGEYVLRRKHTRHILRDLPKMISAGMGTYFDQKEMQAKLVERLREQHLNPIRLDHLLVEGAERGIITYSDIRKVKSEFYDPSVQGVAHEQTGWGAHNAFTYHLQKYSEGSRVNRTLRLSGLFRTQFAPDLVDPRVALREAND